MDGVIDLLHKTALLLSFVGLAACTSPDLASTQTAIPSVTQVPSATTPPTASPVAATHTPLPPTVVQTSPQPTPSTTPELTICSPLEGIPLANLADTIFNPFAPPRLGSDDPHQGVDFADIDPLYQLSLEGRPVNAVVNGVVAVIIVDRFPYGNAVLVETPLEQIPATWLAALQIPTPAPPRTGHPSLTCPEGDFMPNWDTSQRSIYLMYAHLKDPVALTPGELIRCGQTIGAIGNSGNSLNPHLHLEIRIGPAQARFESLAHYTGSASPEEMSNYCLWRVSETFQLLDPMRLLMADQ